MKIPNFIRENIWIILIILIAGFLRLYNIYNLTTFSGEEGYDLNIVKRIIVDKDITLLGPKSGPYNNISEVHLGPFYYYWILPALLISNLNPIGPSIFSAIISIITLVIIYFGLKKHFNNYIAITASAIYSVSTFSINQSRSSSPAFYVPFFSALTFILLLELSKNNKMIYYFFIGILLGLLVQLHYSNVPLILILIGAPYLLKFKITFGNIICFIIGTSIASSGLILFELRHEFFISKSILAQLAGVSSNSNQIWPIALLNSYIKSTQLFFPVKIQALKFIGPIILLTIPIFIWKKSFSKNLNIYYKFVFYWVIVNIICITFFPGEIQKHYFNLSLLPILVLTSLLIYKLEKTYKIGIIIFIFIIFTNALLIDISSDHGDTMPRGLNLHVIKKASERIYKDQIVENKSFNVASVLDGDTRARPYRYFLEANGLKPNNVENYPDSQLIYLISRDVEKSIKGYSVWEVSSFAPFNITNLGEINNGIYLYKLRKI